MDINPAPSRSALTPAAMRVAIERLRSWLPAGPVALRGDVPGVLLQGLRQAGVAVQDAASGAASGMVVLEHIDAADADKRIPALLIGLAGPVCLLVVGQAAATGSRAVWEAAVIRSEWRKHPLNERVAPYGELDRVTGLLMLAFERVPEAALRDSPRKALEEGSELHTDMTREPGRRSDAYLTRYAQAAQFIRAGDKVIDVACGMGYGSYQLAHSSHAASFTGLDASEYAVDYANSNFAPFSPIPMTFAVGDAQNLSGMADGSADFAVSVETLEYLPQPDHLLAELHRVLSPQGRVYASVPNDWSDETGEDPSPFHFHVYDWPRLVAQFQRNGFVIEKAWLQDAGGGQKRHLSVRSMLEIDPQTGPVCDGEWLLVLARKVDAPQCVSDDPLRSVHTLLAAGRREDALRKLEAVSSDVDVLQRARADALAAVLAVADGRTDLASAHWRKVQAAVLRALAVDNVDGEAADLLHLAASGLTSATSARSGALQGLYESHAALISTLLGMPPSLLTDIDDRAVVSGRAEDAGQINLGASEIRQLMDAKQWLDDKYREHMQRIAELERYTAELEIARQWLDRQYHALTDEVQRLNTALTLSANGSG